jgi:copper/silver efflux system protein
VGKPYLEIDIDREAIARYGIKIQMVQDVIEVAIGGKAITQTVEGRERYPFEYVIKGNLGTTLKRLKTSLFQLQIRRKYRLKSSLQSNILEARRLLKVKTHFL